jgi:hypothetical protein
MAEAELNIDTLVRHQIGEPGTPIHRIKEKTVRADVQRLLEAKQDVFRIPKYVFETDSGPECFCLL